MLRKIKRIFCKHKQLISLGNKKRLSPRKFNCVCCGKEKMITTY